mgnify:FL=1
MADTIILYLHLKHTNYPMIYDRVVDPAPWFCNRIRIQCLFRIHVVVVEGEGKIDILPTYLLSLFGVLKTKVL